MSLLRNKINFVRFSSYDMFNYAFGMVLFNKAATEETLLTSVPETEQWSHWELQRTSLELFLMCIKRQTFAGCYYVSDMRECKTKMHKYRTLNLKTIH